MNGQSALILTGQGYGNLIMATPTIAAVASLGYETHVLVESNWSDAATLLTGWPILAGVHERREEVTGRVWDVVVSTVWSRSYNDLHLENPVTPEHCDMRYTHESDVNLTAAQKLGYMGHIPVTHCEYDPMPSKGPYIALCPGYGGANPAMWRRKAWPHWEALCEMLPLPVAIVGCKADLAGWMRPRMRFLGLPIREAAGVLAGAEYVIACDNGLAHIASALGKGTIVLFGGTSEIKNRPIGRDVRIVAAPMSCRPCQMTERWDACRDWECMKAITPEHVLKAVK